MPRLSARRQLAPGGLLAGLALTGAALSLGALHAEPVSAAPRAAHARPAPSPAPAAPLPARASRGLARTALPPTRFVTRYVPVGHPFSGTASWYGGRFVGRHTANGERFDTDRLTAASRTLPFGTRLRVCRHDRCVVVRINDRGPYVGGRVLDLSRAARDRLGHFGVARVTATPVESRRVALHPRATRRQAVRRAPVPAPAMVAVSDETPARGTRNKPDALLATGTLLAAGSALAWARRLRRSAP